MEEGGVDDDNSFLIIPRDVSVSVYGSTATVTLVEYVTPQAGPQRKTTTYNTSIVLRRLRLVKEDGEKEEKWLISHMHTSPATTTRQEQSGASEDDLQGRLISSIIGQNGGAGGQGGAGRGVVVRNGKASSVDLSSILEALNKRGGVGGAGGNGQIIRITSAGGDPGDIFGGDEDDDEDDEDDDDDDDDDDDQGPAGRALAALFKSSSATSPVTSSSSPSPSSSFTSQPSRKVFSSCLSLLRTLRSKSLLSKPAFVFLSSSVVTHSITGEAGFVVRAYELLGEEGEGEEFVDVCKNFYEGEKFRGAGK